MLTQEKRQELARQFKDDLLQMRRCLSNAGYDTTDDELVIAWSSYSNVLCAGWLSLPEEQHLLQILLSELQRSGQTDEPQRLRVPTTREASGAITIKIPAELLEQLGWEASDEIQVSTVGKGALLIERALG